MHHFREGETKHEETINPSILVLLAWCRPSCRPSSSQLTTSGIAMMVGGLIVCEEGSQNEQ
jgi:hypothetical protein